MSQAEPKQPEPDRTVNKQVQLIAYLSDQSYDDWRRYCQDHDDEVNYYERRTRETVSRFLKGLGEEIRLSEDQFKKFRENDLGVLEAVETVDEKETWKTSPKDYVKSVLSTVIEAILSDLEPDWSKRYTWGRDLEHSETDATISFSWDTRNIGLLKHRSEATEDDLFEDQKPRMAMEFQLKLNDAPPEVADDFDERVATAFIKTLSKSDEVERVRMYDCERETSEKGVCLVV